MGRAKFPLLLHKYLLKEQAEAAEAALEGAEVVPRPELAEPEVTAVYLLY
jgi:hypothetical protein